MADREKVITLLTEMAEYFKECRSNASFASKAENHFWELQNAAQEAAELLKEQEAVEPEVDVLNEIDRLYRCPKCHKYFFHRKQRYCDQCGQAVKWDGR